MASVWLAAAFLHLNYIIYLTVVRREWRDQTLAMVMAVSGLQMNVNVCVCVWGGGVY